jgi:predicted nucleotidyltransferase
MTKKSAIVFVDIYTRVSRIVYMSIREIRRKISPVLEKYGVVKAALFGSIVSGTATKRSDIDLLVKLPNNASLLDLAGLKIDLEEKLGKKLDVLTYNSLHPLLRETILKSQKIIV